jgi:hypothetical protein
LQFELDSLHGQATVLAALVSVSPKIPLGYPARYWSLFCFILSRVRNSQYYRHTYMHIYIYEILYYLYRIIFSGLCRFYCLEMSPKGSSLERFPSLSKKKKKRHGFSLIMGFYH